MCPQQNMRVNANEQQQQSETKHTKNTLIGFDAVEMHVRKSNNRNKTQCPNDVRRKSQRIRNVHGVSHLWHDDDEAIWLSLSRAKN